MISGLKSQGNYLLSLISQTTVYGKMQHSPVFIEQRTRHFIFQCAVNKFGGILIPKKEVKSKRNLKFAFQIVNIELDKYQEA